MSRDNRSVLTRVLTGYEYKYMSVSISGITGDE
jgi:hypothetical protein